MDIITIILLVVLALLTGVFLVRSKLMGALAFILKFGFPALAALLLLALFVPQVFDSAADFALRQNGTHQSITSIDDSLDPILSLPGNIFDGIGDLFGGNNNDDETPSETGVLENKLYPGIVSLFSGILRLVAIVFSLLGLVAIIYLSYTLEGSLSVHALKSQVKHLEARVAELESRLKPAVV